MVQINLDNAATTRVDDRVMEEMLPFFSEKYGNPSSTHYLGEEAKRVVEEGRKTISNSIGAKYDEIIFTSGGTESNNLAIKGIYFHLRKINSEKNHIITTKVEHDCVLNSCKFLEENFGVEITYLDVHKEGFIDLNQLKNSLTPKTFLVSIIHGNNEIGTIQNLEEIGKIIKSHRGGKEIAFHTDACQSYTKVPIDVDKMKLDFVTINAHKIHGPKGVGALYVRKDYKKMIIPIASGGGHEQGLRSGTLNVPGIIGLAKAVSISSYKDVDKVRELRDYTISELLKIEGVKLNGAKNEQTKKGLFGKMDKRLANNVNVVINGVEGEMLGSYLNAKQIYTSTGSACASHHAQELSHVLSAIGLNKEEIKNSIRITLSKYNTKEEIDFALEEIRKTIEKLR